MKVVLFCGGLGTRLREHSETMPKPMVPIGDQPILWHLMRYYAHFGHTEFVLCLGYRGEQIRRHFLERAGAAAGAAVGAVTLRLRDGDLPEWRVTLVDTGGEAGIGERLLAVRGHLEDAPMFLANYSDGLSDLPLDRYLEHVRCADRVAGMVCVRPCQSFHTVVADAAGDVLDVRPAAVTDLWINGGFFAFKREIFDYIGPGEDLVEAPFRRLVAARQLTAYRHEGFWACMDTYKDKKAFDDRHAAGDTPWQLWRQG